MKKEMQAPCRDCAERRVGCHAACPKYQAYAADRVRVRAERAVQAEATSARYDTGAVVRKIWQSHKDTKRRRRL